MACIFLPTAVAALPCWLPNCVPSSAAASRPLPAFSADGRVKRLQEPPGAREQVVVVWSSARDTPSPGRSVRNAAQVGFGGAEGLVEVEVAEGCCCLRWGCGTNRHSRCWKDPRRHSQAPAPHTLRSWSALTVPCCPGGLPRPPPHHPTPSPPPPQEALLECVRRVVFQEHSPMGQAATVRLLVNRTQEQGVVDK